MQLNGDHDVFGDADRVAIGHLGDGDPTRDRGFQVDVVRPDARRDSHLQILRLGDPLCRQIGRPERLRDHDVRIHKLIFEP